MEPIRGRCRDCARPFLLRELVRCSGGRCPSCGVLLAPGHTLLLLEEARRADELQRRYVRCLQRLDGLPGALELDVDAIVRGALQAAGLEEQLADDARVLREEVGAATARVRSWRWLPRPRRDELAPQVVAAVRRVGQRLRHHGALLQRWNATRPAEETVATDALAQAAAEVEAAAAAVAEDRRLCDDRTARAMVVARRAVDEAEQAVAASKPEPHTAVGVDGEPGLAGTAAAAHTGPRGAGLVTAGTPHPEPAARR